MTNFNNNVEYNVREIRINSELPFFRYHETKFKSESSSTGVSAIYFRTSLDSKEIFDLYIPSDLEIDFTDAEIRF